MRGRGGKAPLKGGAGGKASSLGFCAYIGGCGGISAPVILPTLGWLEGFCSSFY